MQHNSTTQLHPRTIDITGQRFGRLLVVSFSYMKNRHAFWNCLCDCGNECQIRGGRLRNGDTKSCGCFQIEQSIKRNCTNGLSYHPLRKMYQSMITRCYNPNVKDYHNYGGRGITVCARWRDSFANFLEDMGERPEGYTLDRIDNDGSYSPENCRWASLLQQGNNKRSNRFLLYNGKNLTMQQWSTLTGINKVTISRRIRSGWSIERTLTEPARTQHRHKA